MISFTFIHLADALIQSDLQLRKTISDAFYEVLVIQHFWHCSEQKLARQGEAKERQQRCFSFFVFYTYFFIKYKYKYYNTKQNLKCSLEN